MTTLTDRLLESFFHDTVPHAVRASDGEPLRHRADFARHVADFCAREIEAGTPSYLVDETRAHAAEVLRRWGQRQ